jgi:hypothetical protein
LRFLVAEAPQVGEPPSRYFVLLLFVPQELIVAPAATARACKLEANRKDKKIVTFLGSMNALQLSFFLRQSLKMSETNAWNLKGALTPPLQYKANQQNLMGKIR